MISLPLPRSTLACARVAAILALLPGAALHADEPVVWTNAVGVSVSGNSLTKTGTNVTWDAGAASRNVVRDGYGYVEFVATETNKYRMCGLSNGDSGASYTDIDFAIFLLNDSTVQIYEGGNYKTSVGGYASGDVFRVEVVYGVVRYLRNGALLYTSAAVPRFPLRVDASLYDPGATLTAATVGNTTWANAVGAAVSGNGLRKSSMTPGWNAGAASTNTVESGDGFLEFVATETTTTRAVGLSGDDADQTLADIEYAIQLKADGAVEVDESGISRGTFGTYSSGDRFRVEVRQGSVQYVRNGVAFYTSAFAPAYPMRADASLYTTGATLVDVRVERLIWTNETGVLVQGNGLVKTGSDGWTSAASSTWSIESGDGFLEVTAVETDKRRAIGLKRAGSATTYSDLDFAIDLGADGVVTLFELGVSKGTFGSYANGDRLRVEIQNGVAKYRKNGVVFYTSASAPVYPIHADATLYSSGATLVDVAVGDLVWGGEVGVGIGEVGLVKTGASGAWDAGASSTRLIDNGYVEFTATETSRYRMLGLGAGDSSVSYTDIEYALFLSNDSTLQVYESGTYRGTFSYYGPGDRLRVAVEAGVVTYWRNGTLLYTSSVTATGALRVDTSLNDQDAKLFNIVLSGQVQVATPTFSPAGATYSTPQNVTIATSTAGATIRYTTDGTEPTMSSASYSSPVAVASPSVLKARAWKTGYQPSTTGIGTYVMVVATASIVPGAGSYVGALPVSVSTATPGADLHYRLDGAEPSEADPIVTGGSLSLDRSGTLRVKGFRTGWMPSATAGGIYWINLGTAVAPAFTPSPGTFTAAQNVTITTTTSGATIRYTTDGKDPDPRSPVYSGPISVARTTEIRARAFKADMVASSVTTGLYVINLGTADAPRVSPGSGAYPTALSVTATSATAGATIRYTTNGADPVETDSSVASGGTIAVSKSTRLKLRAYASGLAPSAVVTVDYVIVGSVAGGRYHSIALKSDGTVWAWGDNGYGQIGDGTQVQRLSAVAVSGLSGVIAISSRYNHTVALKADGTVWTWGQNSRGQLGDGTTTQRLAPVQVQGLSDVTSIAAGAEHTLALKRDGTVWAWGNNSSGQLGDGTGTDRYTPVQVGNLTGVSGIAAGYWFSVAVKTDGTAAGTVWAWGDGQSGQLGNGAAFWFNSSPVQVVGLTSVTAVACGGAHALALGSSGVASAWGAGSFGELGDAAGLTRSLPTTVALSPISVLAAGGSHSLALTPDGVIWGWGHNLYYQLGEGSTLHRFEPVRTELANRVIAIAAGEAHGLALRDDGRVLAWGYNGQGQLGSGNTNSDYRPMPVPDFTTADQSWLSGDADGDGLRNDREAALGTDPMNWDTNGDGISDGAAVNAGMSATNLDMDADGLSNALELQQGTDPFRADTDGDGTADAADCFPLDPTRWQCPPAVPGDTSPPVITLSEPTNASLISSVPPQ